MSNPVKIIFLNAVGSVGKTSIAKMLQAILDETYLHVGVDQFIEMMPETYIGHKQGIHLIFIKNSLKGFFEKNTSDKFYYRKLNLFSL